MRDSKLRWVNCINSMKGSMVVCRWNSVHLKTFLILSSFIC